MLTVEEIHVFACLNDEGATIRSFETEGEAAAFAEGFNSAAKLAAPNDPEPPMEFDQATESNPAICALDDVTEDAEPLEPSF
jgi:hypothetical protein